MLSEEDVDLELIKAKKLLEMKKRLLTTDKSVKKDPRSVLVERLVDRGVEVLEAAEALYPEETRILVKRLAELIEKGVITGYISGGALLSLFRRLGLNIRIETKISIEEDGRLMSLTDKLKRSGEEE